MKIEGLISISKKKEIHAEKKVNDKINMTELLSFVNGNGQLLNSTLELIHTTLKEDMNTILSQVDIGNYDGVRMIAHRIKPNYALLGLSGLKALCQEIEQKHNNSELEHPVKELVERTKSVFLAIEKELKNELIRKN
jgi:HPt (histidine-containing phosphotransfer) domain-containing protein